MAQYLKVLAPLRLTFVMLWTEVSLLPLLTLPKLLKSSSVVYNSPSTIYFPKPSASHVHLEWAFITERKGKLLSKHTNCGFYRNIQQSTIPLLLPWSLLFESSPWEEVETQEVCACKTLEEYGRHQCGDTDTYHVWMKHSEHQMKCNRSWLDSFGFTKQEEYKTQMVNV